MRSIRRLDAADDVDSLTSVANLFDIGVIFGIGVLTLLAGTIVESNETVDPDRHDLVRYRESTDRSLAGDGERLGVAYRLEDGQVVYVPDGAARSDAIRESTSVDPGADGTNGRR